MNVIKALQNIQQELKAPKGQYNSFGKYNYRSCEDILEAVKPLLNKNNATLALSDEIFLIGSRFYIKATAELSAIEGTEVTTKTVTAYAREDEAKKGMDGSQITGTASSYARKYALNGLFCIDDTKDADTPEQHTEQTARTAAKTQRNAESAAKTQQLTDKERLIRYWGKMSPQAQQAVLDGYKIANINDLTPGMVDHWSNCLKAKNIAY